MALVTNAILSVGSVRVGAATRTSFAPSNTNAPNSFDYVSTATGSDGFRVAQLTYARQDVATTSSILATESYAQASHPSGTVANVYGGQYISESAGAGAVGNLHGAAFNAGVTGAGNVTAANSVVAQSIFRTGSGTIATARGILVQAQTAGTVNHAIETLGTASVKLGGMLEAAGEIRAGVNQWIRSGVATLIRVNPSAQLELDCNGAAVALSNILQTTTVGAAGGAALLPGAPLGYFWANFNGVTGLIPFYAPPP